MAWLKSSVVFIALFSSASSSGVCRANNGAEGLCKDVVLCSGTPESGHCPGSSSIQCCYDEKCTADGKNGICKLVSNCKGTPVAGHCPGSADNQCCVDEDDGSSGSPDGDCKAYSVSGNCKSVSSCHSESGISVPGFCPGSTSEQCCIKATQNDCGFVPETYYDAYDRGQNIGKIGTVKLLGKNIGTVTGCHFLKMRTAADVAGIPLILNSGFRTYEEQQHLYNCYHHCTSGCGSCNLAARPGYSNHEDGHAVDINIGSTTIYNWLKSHGHDYSFVRTVPSEKWHWEYRPGQAPAPYT